MAKFRFRCLPIFVVLAASAAPFVQAQSNASLERVLNSMDEAERNFRSTEASFVWDDYQAVVKDTQTQKGKIYFRRSGKETDVAVDITAPTPPKYLRLIRGKLQVFETGTDQVTVYDLQKSHPEFESFLTLGFGGGGHSLLQAFDVSYAGTETIDGIETAKLNLVPKSQKVLGMFPHIVLWIDPARGISLRQQLFQGEGDYRLANYSDIQQQRSIPDKVFKLKTDSSTTYRNMSSEN